ncbi:MAG: hypothetical protein OCD01_17425 [Fibrobacterales bacterium]
MKLSIYLLFLCSLFGLSCTEASDALSVQDSSSIQMGESSSTTQSSTVVIATSIDFSVEPCRATFTETYEVTDLFGDTVVSIQVGESYIIGDSSQFFGRYEFDLYEETNRGVFEFTVKIPDTVSSLPFTSSCDLLSAHSYMGAFVAADVYSDPDMSFKVCSVPEAEIAETSSYHIEAITTDFISGNYTYLYRSFPFEQLCGVLDSGYVAAKSIEFEGERGRQVVLPFKMFMSQD